MIDGSTRDARTARLAPELPVASTADVASFTKSRSSLPIRSCLVALSPVFAVLILSLNSAHRSCRSDEDVDVDVDVDAARDVEPRLRLDPNLRTDPADAALTLLPPATFI